MKIIVDAMGGDYAPQNIVAGAVDAVNEQGEKLILVGIPQAVETELKKYKYPKDHIEIYPASEVVGMDEPAITPIRKKRNSSIAVGVNLLKQDGYSAFVSAGNTGAVVAASTFNLGMIPGVERPAIGLVIPSLKGLSFLIDVGANTTPKPEHLMQSALMANIYVQEVLGIENPRIGLLNIGEEETKGTDFAKETHRMMAERLKNFIGNIEANEVFSGKGDCIICDGFVGNVIIKVSEHVMESSKELIMRHIKKDPLALLGGLLMKNCLSKVKRYADYSEYGGAPLLGVNGNIIISHGRSNAKAIKNAIRVARREIEHNLLGIMTREIGGK